MDVWQFIRQSDGPVALLYVTESKGSSPGRKGFKMAIRNTGEMCGSIGGGIMEQNLVHWAIERLAAGEHETISRRQIHRSGEGDDFSGLICSGEQSVLMTVVIPETVLNSGYIVISEDVVSFCAEKPIGNFLVIEPVGQQDTVYIIGGGHVGLALSQTMSQLDFRVEIFDDRSELNTIENNEFADKKHLGDLEASLSLIPESADVYVVAVTFGITTDRIVLKHLLDRDFRYFGLMGSEAKLRALKKEFGELKSVHAPIGLPIHSHTPGEIAISIAAEIIQVKNSSQV